jgi:NB-ARC domain
MRKRGRKASEKGLELIIGKLELRVEKKYDDYGFNTRVLDYLCEQIEDITISQTTVSNLFSRTNIDRPKFEAICRLLDEDPDEISNPGSTIPRPPSNFVGRDDDLDKLTELVLTKKVRLIYLKGISGIGKKSLVSQLIEKKLRNELTVWVNFSYNEPHNTLIADLVRELSLVSQKKVNKGNRSDEAILWEYLKTKRYVIILNHNILGDSQESPYDLKYEEFLLSLCSPNKIRDHKSSIILITDRRIGNVFTRIDNLNLCQVQTLKELKAPDSRELLKSKFNWDNYNNKVINRHRNEVIDLLASKIGHPMLLISTADCILRSYYPEQDDIISILSKDIQEVFVLNNLSKIINRNLETLSKDCRIILRLFVNDEQISLATIQTYCCNKGISIFGVQRAFKEIENLSFLLCKERGKNSLEDIYVLGKTVETLIFRYLESNPD